MNGSKTNILIIGKMSKNGKILFAIAFHSTIVSLKWQKVGKLQGKTASGPYIQMLKTCLQMEIFLEDQEDFDAKTRTKIAKRRSSLRL